MSLPLMISALWAVLLLALYLWLSRRDPFAVAPEWQAGAVIVAVSLLARLVPELLLPVGAAYDITSYGIVGDLVHQGRDIYASPAALNRYPYLPLQLYWMAFAGSLSDGAHLPFVAVVRLAPIAADVGIALVLWTSLRRSVELSRFAFQGALLYAINPLPVLVSAYHGQFDAIPLLCILLAMRSLPALPLVAGGWLGLGILDKSWPVLLGPSLLLIAQSWRGRLRFVAGVALVPLAGIVIYLLAFDAQIGTMFERVLGYNRGVGVWGYTYFFNLLGNLWPELNGIFLWFVLYGKYLTLAALAVVWLLRARHEPPAASTLTVLVAFLAVTHAFSIQYLTWLVPFAILGGEVRWLTRYTLGAFAYMLLAYTTLILEMHITNLLPWPQADWFIIIPAGLPAWFVTVAWLRQRLRGEQPGIRTPDPIYRAVVPNEQL